MYSYVTVARRIPVIIRLERYERWWTVPLRMDAEMEAMYASGVVHPLRTERLLRGKLLMILYSIRSERQLMEQLDYNLLFRWFVGLEMDDAVWDVTVFTKNRERLIAGAGESAAIGGGAGRGAGARFAQRGALTGDGTPIQAWAPAELQG